ncbi:hypothetical protein [Burkholderia phage BCSR5]|nr:hypothetical protein [Burkholderia phage BCSR5]
MNDFLAAYAIGEAAVARTTKDIDALQDVLNDFNAAMQVITKGRIEVSVGERANSAKAYYGLPAAEIRKFCMPIILHMKGQDPKQGKEVGYMRWAGYGLVSGLEIRMRSTSDSMAHNIQQVREHFVRFLKDGRNVAFIQAMLGPDFDAEISEAA